MDWGHLGLTLHLIGVACWLGGAVYERLFIFGSIRKNQGTPMEVFLTGLMLRTVPFFGASILLLLVGGIIMTVAYNLGVFHLNWIGFKQYILALLVLLLGTMVAPRMKRIGADLRALKDQSVGLPAAQRATLQQVKTWLDVIHAGVVINLLLGIWRPF